MHTHTLYLLLMLVDTYALLISTNYHNIYSVLKNKKKTYFFFSVCCFACSKNKVYISPVLEAFDSAASLCSFWCHDRQLYGADSAGLVQSPSCCSLLGSWWCHNRLLYTADSAGLVQSPSWLSFPLPSTPVQHVLSAVGICRAPFQLQRPVHYHGVNRHLFSAFYHGVNRHLFSAFVASID